MENKYEIIEQYLSGQLAGKELGDFKRRLEIDTNLAEDVELLRQVRQAIKIHNNEEKLNKTLNKIGENYFPEKKITIRNHNQKKTIMTRVAMAASIVLFVFVGLFLWNKQIYNNQALAAFYKIETDNSDRKEIVNISTEDLINEIDSQYLYYQYLYAGEMLTNRDYEKAKDAYNNVLQNQEKSNYITKDINFEAAKWNLILTDLALGNEVKEQLSQLLQSPISETYKKDAQSLQNDINSFWHRLVN